MSLENINLSETVLIELYKNVLVLDKFVTTDKSPANNSPFKYLGDNQKNITILINNTDSGILSDKDFNFLAGILNACRLNMSDVAIINLHNVKEKNYVAINNVTNPVTVFIFGIEQSEIGLPIQFPYFQPQPYSNVTYLCAPELKILSEDRLLKSKLWVSLKTLFDL
ncbi:MAG: hypothetical protein C5B52_06965 [Bacteroidetes bacterium]|nr:MAG: hypothetical protein C5B52_06965 [Bacteroidota bacterium]